MTREQALRQAVRRWGKRALIRANTNQSSPERRAAAIARRAQLKERRDAIDAEINERLSALDWYQQLIAERKALLDEQKSLTGTDYYKFAVGREEMGGFWIKGEGDTWEQAFEAADLRARVDGVR